MHIYKGISIAGKENQGSVAKVILCGVYISLFMITREYFYTFCHVLFILQAQSRNVVISNP